MINQPVDGQAIRRARSRMGFPSGYALAAVVGVSEQHMLRIERGVRQPSPSLFRKLVDVLDADEEDFLLPEREPSRRGQPA